MPVLRRRRWPATPTAKGSVLQGSSSTRRSRSAATRATTRTSSSPTTRAGGRASWTASSSRRSRTSRWSRRSRPELGGRARAALPHPRGRGVHDHRRRHRPREAGQGRRRPRRQRALHRDRGDQARAGPEGRDVLPGGYGITYQTQQQGRGRAEPLRRASSRTTAPTTSRPPPSASRRARRSGCSSTRTRRRSSSTAPAARASSTGRRIFILQLTKADEKGDIAQWQNDDVQLDGSKEQKAGFEYGESPTAGKPLPIACSTRTPTSRASSARSPSRASRPARAPSTYELALDLRRYASRARREPSPTLVVVAIDAAGNRSRTATLAFRIGAVAVRRRAAGTAAAVLEQRPHDGGRRGPAEQVALHRVAAELGRAGRARRCSRRPRRRRAARGRARAGSSSGRSRRRRSALTRSTTKRRSIFSSSTGKSLRWASDEKPVPKSSIATRHAEATEVAEHGARGLGVGHERVLGQLELEEPRRAARGARAAARPRRRCRCRAATGRTGSPRSAPRGRPTARTRHSCHRGVERERRERDDEPAALGHLDELAGRQDPEPRGAASG